MPLGVDYHGESVPETLPLQMLVKKREHDGAEVLLLRLEGKGVRDEQVR